ncbi:SDR family NAD(P)-dependent oxidoreductase [Sphingobium naphthae]|uniref:SDR family oxidoreductase n=1 Tax=Sphingobium naphthae TaxID=1886786 RepID=A0ABU4A113_9SPHN|nr:SDR family oxidoreductase [Sphingobium naphthae]MCC4250817.1 SDR family oxidoreductase [Sphingobium naphthae]MDV5825458.1 SDR family oxidoreductase [Sphingobium naphthae]
MTGRLAGKVTLISGTGGGQGRAAALRFAAEGALIFGCDISADGQRETIELVRAARGIMQGLEGAADIACSAGASAWVDAALAEYGRIDILYNNASAAKFAPIEQMSDEDWHFTLRNEIDIVFFPTRAAWPHLARPGGVVINVGSTAGWAGSPGAGTLAHNATKGAVIAMTRQLAIEGAPHGIRAVSLSPGFVRTAGTAAFLEKPDIRAKLTARIPLGRPGEPEEIVAAAVFIASDEASFLTGTDLVVDGGSLAI